MTFHDAKIDLKENSIRVGNNNQKRFTKGETKRNRKDIILYSIQSINIRFLTFDFRKGISHYEISFLVKIVLSMHIALQC